MSGLELRLLETWLRGADLLAADPRVVGTPVSDTIGSACVDSRLALPGCLFVALPGEKADGHEFVDDAIGRGAVAALIRGDRLAQVRSRLFGSAVLYPVDDVLKALHTIAGKWCATHPRLLKVGVTGSNGKTTTKEFIAAILAHAGPTVFSRGNYNSDIGLPMELLRIRADHRFGVFELGMNRPGEIGELTGILRPDVALITNVGSAHVGMLGSKRRIAEEKKSIFGSFSGAQTAIVPPAGEFARFLAADIKGKVVRYGRSAAGVLRIEDHGVAGTTLHLREGLVRLRLPGEHMVSNALAALTVARVIEIPFDAVKAGIESVRPMFGRTQILSGRATIVQDCYNANPESMSSALTLLSRLPTDGKRIAVLGAMKELGDETQAAHRGVVAAALESGVDEVWLVGDEFGPVVPGPEVTPDTATVRYFPTDRFEELEHAASNIPDGDAVLLKGSRALELERLTPVIQGGVRTAAGRLVRG